MRSDSHSSMSSCLWSWSSHSRSRNREQCAHAHTHTLTPRPDNSIALHEIWKAIRGSRVIFCEHISSNRGFGCRRGGGSGGEGVFAQVLHTQKHTQTDSFGGGPKTTSRQRHMVTKKRHRTGCCVVGNSILKQIHMMGASFTLRTFFHLFSRNTLHLWGVRSLSSVSLLTHRVGLVEPGRSQLRSAAAECSCS